jgi:multidrug efflux pump subunit AcrA (membrane-fusion protein)
MSQVLTITNLTTSQIDLVEGILPPSGLLVVTVGDTVPSDILSAQANGHISFTSAPVVGQEEEVAVVGGGASLLNIDSAATTNAAIVKATPGKVYGWSLRNKAAYDVWVNFYDVATLPVVGTTPVKFTKSIATLGDSEFVLPVGIGFVNGIGISITVAAGTAVAAGDLIGELYFD